MQKLTTLSIEQWCELWRAEAIEQGAELACVGCDGEGVTECCECGNHRECDECSGSGKLEARDLTVNAMVINYYYRKQYQEQLQQDLIRYARWQGVDFLWWKGSLIDARNKLAQIKELQCV